MSDHRKNLALEKMGSVAEVFDEAFQKRVISIIANVHLRIIEASFFTC
jgi:hypothetical protein